MIYDVIVVGGGPAGLTSAVYACRAGKSVLVIEKNAFGGQITWSPLVENFPGFVSAAGTELGDRFLEQAMAQGADVELDEVVSVRSNPDGLKTLVCESGLEFLCRTLIISVGARPRKLGVEREDDLVGNGVCYCAVCDGAFFANQPVALCGGGNAALQDALLLSEKCSHVYLIHRRNMFRGEQRLVDALKSRENVTFLMNTRVAELRGSPSLDGLVLDQDGEHVELSVSGLFVAIGHQPDNHIFSEFIDLDSSGYASSGEDCLTKCPGIFVAGDCRAKAVRQLTTAVADGAVAALAACRYLDIRDEG